MVLQSRISTFKVKNTRSGHIVVHTILKRQNISSRQSYHLTNPLTGFVFFEIFSVTVLSFRI